MQMLFQWDITRDSIDQIAATFFDGLDEPPAVADFARQLVTRTVEHVEEIDRILSGYGFHRLKDHGANSFYSKDRHAWLVRLQLALIPG